MTILPYIFVCILYVNFKKKYTFFFILRNMYAFFFILRNMYTFFFIKMKFYFALLSSNKIITNIMGNIFPEDKYTTERHRQQAAYDIYAQRIKDYNPTIHGNRINYMQCVQAQFRIDCLPNNVKCTGTDYDRMNDRLCIYNEIV